MGIIQKTIGGVKRMFGVREIVDNFKFVESFSKDVIGSELKSSSTGERPLTIEQDKLQATKATFKKLVISYLIIAFAAFLYFTYNMATHNYIVALLSVAFILLCLSFAFRYHFWLFQMKKGRLGCSFSEWLQDTLGKGA
ncbi:MAG: hypothetical protein K0Q57_17 [Gammaproteobacteria bacterium]|jgi:hypothetical protein|nr:hypothetical protein [Gammaproteobacteria bacterium]